MSEADVTYQELAVLARSILQKQLRLMDGKGAKGEKRLEVNFFREIRSALKDFSALAESEALTGTAGGGDEYADMPMDELQRRLDAG